MYLVRHKREVTARSIDNNLPLILLIPASMIELINLTKMKVFLAVLHNPM